MRFFGLLIGFLGVIVLLDNGTAWPWLVLFAVILFVGGSIKATLRESRSYGRRR